MVSRTTFLIFLLDFIIISQNLKKLLSYTIKKELNFGLTFCSEFRYISPDDDDEYMGRLSPHTRELHRRKSVKIFSDN